ncbi:MAG: hypothetical protein IKO47_11335 [Ruminococcus sp.]|nr:hypothetical protein [Ruminococcus sp.]
MKINKMELVTEVRETQSLSQVCGDTAALGQPCMLIVYGGADFRADASFPADIPFITAFAADDAESVSADISGAFDMVIPAGDAEDFAGKLFKDKTEKQIHEINKCFIAARTGSQEDILACESRAFYRLMAEKNGGAGNE